jgi:hypothetical protein
VRAVLDVFRRPEAFRRRRVSLVKERIERFEHEFLVFLLDCFFHADFPLALEPLPVQRNGMSCYPTGSIGRNEPISEELGQHNPQ